MLVKLFIFKFNVETRFLEAQMCGSFYFYTIMRLLFDKSFMQPDDMVE